MNRQAIPVIILDTDPAAAAPIEAFLAAAGYRPSVVAIGEEAAIPARAILVVQVEPPAMLDRSQLLLACQEAGVPVIASSELLATPTHRELLKRTYGLLDVLARPIDPQALLQLVQRAAWALPPVALPDSSPSELPRTVATADRSKLDAPTEAESPILDADELGIEEDLSDDSFDDAGEPRGLAPTVEVDSFPDIAALDAPAWNSWNPDLVPDDGSLDDHAIATVLASAAIAGYDGSLLLASEAERLEVVFLSGAVVAARSNRAEERLGALLVSDGRLSPESAERIAAEAKATGSLFGATLISSGLVSAADVQTFLRLQLRLRVEGLLGWRAGRFGFRSLPFVEEQAVAGAPQLGEMLWAGIRHLLPLSELRGLASALASARLTMSAEPPIALPHADFTPAQAALVAGWAPGTANRRAAGPFLADERLARLTYLLVTSGSVQVTPN
jgi:hypothetical protein